MDFFETLDLCVHGELGLGIRGKLGLGYTRKAWTRVRTVSLDLCTHGGDDNKLKFISDAARPRTSGKRTANKSI